MMIARSAQCFLKPSFRMFMTMTAKTSEKAMPIRAGGPFRITPNRR